MEGLLNVIDNKRDFNKSMEFRNTMRRRTQDPAKEIQYLRNVVELMNNAPSYLPVILHATNYKKEDVEEIVKYLTPQRL